MTEQQLRRDLGIEAPDDFYNALVDCYRDLNADQVAVFNARLILLLANQVGDRAVLDQALKAAKEGV